MGLTERDGSAGEGFRVHWYWPVFTETERKANEVFKQDPHGLQESAPRTDCSPGTASNLLWESSAYVPSDTTGYNFVEYFDTTGCRKSLRDYSRQYESLELVETSYESVEAPFLHGVQELLVRYERAVGTHSSS